MNEEKIEKSIKDMIEVLHKELGWFNQEELDNTPRRIKDFYKEWERNQNFKFTVFKNHKKYNQMVVLDNIDFYSMCSHHMLPFFGRVHIAYIPSEEGNICGISKLARATKKFASKPQVQENLTEEIADFIQKEINPLGVIVVIEGQHLCMLMRGVKQHNSVMKTSALKGVFLTKPEVRKEFFDLIKK